MYTFLYYMVRCTSNLCKLASKARIALTEKKPKGIFWNNTDVTEALGNVLSKKGQKTVSPNE